MKENLYTDKRMNILINKIGLSKEMASLCYEKSKKYCIWLGNQVIKKPTLLSRQNDIDLILDWKKEVQNINLNEFTFDNALKEARKFQDSLFVPNSNSLKNKNVVINCGDYKWVQLLTKQDCKEEGSAMGHCIGNSSHNQRVSSGNSVAFSLRDKFNRPHLTLEARVKDDKIGKIFEFKGSANGVPNVEYTKYFVELLKKYNFEGVTDHTFFDSVKNSFQIISDINKFNSTFLPFDFKLEVGLNAFEENSSHLKILEITLNDKVKIPKNTKFYSNLSLTCREVEFEGDMLVGGNLIVKADKKVSFGNNIKVGGNINLSSPQIKNKENLIYFGEIVTN